MKLTVSEITGYTNGKIVGNTQNTITKVITDSRKIEPGSLFVAIKGERFDGHDFIKEAYKSGAAAALSQVYIDVPEGKTLILVDDTKGALVDLAKGYRGRFNIPFIAVTGSVGKTTTKEMIHSALSVKYKTHKTSGNFNNEIGLPLTMMELSGEHECAVFEMGMSGFGEIALLSSIVMPDIAVITNIGVSHIEKLGSKENILKAKLEVCENLNKDGYLILNGDDKLLWGLKGKLPFKTIYYGIENKECDYVADKPSNDSFILGTKNIILPVLGRHNIYNALCAIAVANLLDISTDEAVRGLMSFETDGIRQSIIKFGNITFMNDYYNASPPSMEAALDVLGEQTEHRRIAVLGGMLELGEYSKEAHLGVGKYASGDKCDILITVGGDSEYIKEGFIQGGGREAYSFSDNKSAAAFLKSLLKDGDFVLIKGSRGIKMEEIYKSVTE